MYSKVCCVGPALACENLALDQLAFERGEELSATALKPRFKCLQAMSSAGALRNTQTRGLSSLARPVNPLAGSTGTARKDAPLSGPLSDDRIGAEAGSRITRTGPEHPCGRLR